jgi:hypothetical protein
MNIGSFLITHAEPPELIQPRKRPLHHPSPSAQSTAMFCVALGEQRHDVAIAKTLADRFRVITAVA